MAKCTRLILAVLAVAGLVLSGAGCSSDAEGTNGNQRRASTANQWDRNGLGNRGMREATPVEAGTPWRADLASYVFGNANIEALRDVEIVARANGMLQRLPVEEGDVVRGGTVLAELDKSELKINLQENKALLENNRKVFERSKQMIEQQLTSQEELDRAKFNYETALAQYERAQLNLQYTTITAPFSGVITQRLVERGDMIRANTVLFQIADTEKLRIRLHVPEKEMGRIFVGNPARIETEMLPGEYFGGVVEMVAPVVDPATGTIKITVQVTKGQEKLKPGMFCSVYVLIETHKDALVINRRALIPETEVAEVFVIDDSMAVHRRQLKIGITQGDTLEVLGGLREGERVVLVGQESLNEGTPVKIIDTDAPLPVKAPPPPTAERESGGSPGRKPR